MEGYHEPVLLDEVIDALGVRDAWYLDCTLGDGGHSLGILKKGGKVVGIDVDPQALTRACRRLENLRFTNRYKLLTGNFRELKNLIQQTDAPAKFAGAIFDLGVSSLQLMNPEGGFSFTKNGLLDMRMDPSLQVKAVDLVNALSRKELYELFFNLGEEKYSRRLADIIVSTREVSKITTTRQLAGIIEQTCGRKNKRHPATRVFQALRIAVNSELDALQEGLDQVSSLIEKNGRIVVISFHSLEDRIVKDTFRKWEKSNLGKVITKKPMVPRFEELTVNPRARSAKLRIFEYDYN